MNPSSDQKPRFAAQEKWRAENPQKVWAQRALRSAEKAGLVQKQPCKICGDPDSEAHHADYARPMDVDWYCRRHHRAEHSRLNAEGMSNG